MTQLITYTAAHWSDIVLAVGGLVLSARIIVKLTPTPADDSALEKIVSFLKHIGLHIDAK